MAFFARPPSTHVRISHPAGDDAPSPRKDSTQRQCRNIVIYGHCKYQDKGCHYHHPQPLAPAGSLSAAAVNAPVFVPKAAAPASPPAEYDDGQDQFYPDDAQDQFYPDDGQEHFYPDDGQEQFYPQDPPEDTFYDDSMFAASYDPNGLDNLYTHPPSFVRQPLNYLLYTPSIPEEFVPSTQNTHFIPPSQTLRQQLQQQSETIRTIAPPGTTGLPDECQGYHSFVPLEPSTTERRKLGNWYSTVYRAIRASDGRPYTLRRVENYRLMHQSAFSAIELWSNIRHPSIVPVREAFTTKAFNDNSLVVCYAYYPDATTLYDLHFKKLSPAPSTPSKRSTPQQQPDIIPERTLWSYITQLASAIKKIHDLGHPIRMIDPTKILITSQNRIRIGSCGILDVLLHPSSSLPLTGSSSSSPAAGDPSALAALMQEDLTLFGRLVFSLACKNTNAWTAPQFQKSLDWMGRWYKPEIKSVALYLISKSHHSHHGQGGGYNGAGKVKSIDHLMDMIRPRIAEELEESMLATDRLESELSSELENARLVRLLCKFGFINERPEFALEPKWSETGDRYIIKLFRDYVFHQVDEHGNPSVNMSHVLTCLNKLDAGSEEKIMLVSRDDTSCLVVSYKEIKACLEGAFSDLMRPVGTGVVFQPAR